MFRALLSGQRPRLLPAASTESRHGLPPRPRARFGQPTPTRQRGVTAIGWLILLTPFAILIYAGIRLTPVLMNYMAVARSLNELTSEFAGGGASPDAIRSSLQKHFDVESVDYPAVKDIDITRSGQGWTVEAAYYDQAPLFDRVTLQIQFDKTVTVGGGG